MDRVPETLGLGRRRRSVRVSPEVRVGHRVPLHLPGPRRQHRGVPDTVPSAPDRTPDPVALVPVLSESSTSRLFYRTPVPPSTSPSRESPVPDGWESRGRTTNRDPLPPEGVVPTSFLCVCSVGPESVSVLLPTCPSAPQLHPFTLTCAQTYVDTDGRFLGDGAPKPPRVPGSMSGKGPVRVSEGRLPYSEELRRPQPRPFTSLFTPFFGERRTTSRLPFRDKKLCLTA